MTQLAPQDATTQPLHSINNFGLHSSAFIRAPQFWGLNFEPKILVFIGSNASGLIHWSSFIGLHSSGIIHRPLSGHQRPCNMRSLTQGRAITKPLITTPRNYEATHYDAAQLRRRATTRPFTSTPLNTRLLTFIAVL